MQLVGRVRAGRAILRAALAVIDDWGADEKSIFTPEAGRLCHFGSRPYREAQDAQSAW
jgi:hypothetical protein